MHLSIPLFHLVWNLWSISPFFLSFYDGLKVLKTWDLCIIVCSIYSILVPCRKIYELTGIKYIKVAVTTYNIFSKFKGVHCHMIWLILTCLQLWDINMDSGPVATFQVHEYLRPKVRFLCVGRWWWTINFFVPLLSYNWQPFFEHASFVIYMKMIRFLISSSVVWVVTDCE